MYPLLFDVKKMMLKNIGRTCACTKRPYIILKNSSEVISCSTSLKENNFIQCLYEHLRSEDAIKIVQKNDKPLALKSVLKVKFSIPCLKFSLLMWCRQLIAVNCTFNQSFQLQ